MDTSDSDNTNQDEVSSAKKQKLDVTVTVCDPGPVQGKSQVQKFGAMSSNVSPRDSRRYKYDMDVEQILLGDADGPDIVKELKSGMVCFKSRTKMIRILVSDMITKFGPRPPTDAKVSMAKAICERFPSLKDTEGQGYEAFFTPSLGRHTAKGYLEERLRNVRRRMPNTSSGNGSHSTASSSTASSPSTSTSASVSVSNCEDPPVSDERAEEMCRWLQHNIEPTKTVLEYMKATSRKRLNEIRSKDKSLGEILQIWPRMFDNPGMIEEDFISLYDQTTAEQLSTKWTTELTAQLREYACKQRNSKAQEELLVNLPADDPQLFLQCLPLFLPSGRVQKPGGKSRTATQSEALTSFIDQKPVGTNLPSYLNDVQAGSRPQPFVLLLGERSSPSQSYVIFEGRAIETTSLLKAVDACFKAIYVFDTEYQRQCNSTWEFLQKCIFNIPDGKGNTLTSPAVRSLRAYLNSQCVRCNSVEDLIQ